MFGENCPAGMFLNPELFKTDFDALHTPDAKQQRYEYALELGRRANHVSIAHNGVWSAVMQDTSTVQSYEKIGYHALSSYTLKGFLDSGCVIYVYRVWGESPVRIK